ncbi:MAG: hypothetical protein NWR46_08500 [Saprospiraceae bacterium]|nr:hypothetical protein [Saprospiraceae bacterium]
MRQLQIKMWAFMLTFLCFNLSYGQEIDLKRLKGISPRSIGPAGMSGRITAIEVDLSNPQIIYAGAASGGLWRSNNGGTAWESLFDEMDNLSIGSIALNQKNPLDIWVGTGEGNPRNSQNTGKGIYRSRDGGKTWKCLGLENTKTIHRIIIHRDNPDIVYVGAQGSPFGSNPERGVFRTKDGGKTWEKILYVNDQTGVADMVADPSNPNKILVAMWEYGRKPWFFNSGGPGSGLHVTFDGGDTWSKRTDADGLPKGPLGRIGLAIARSKTNIIYALVEAKENGLYKSTDGGFKWTLVGKGEGVSDRPFYYHEIYVDPKNENRIYNLFSLVTRSEDGGKTFQTLLPYYGVHPDHHAFWIHPEDPNYLIDGNDGGLNISRDMGKTWRFIENIPVGQFYHVNYDMSIPYRIGGGMQDNGSWVGPSSIWQQGNIRNTDWQEIYFGDGFDVSFHPTDATKAYAMSQGGNVGQVHLNTGRTQGIKPTHPNPKITLRYNWNAAFAQNPFEPCGLYFGSQFVHKSTDCGKTWEIISPDLTTNDAIKQMQDSTGGLTIDNTAAENHTTILAIAPSPLDKNVIWVGTDDGNLQLTRDGGKTWTNLSGSLPGVKAGSWIPYIEVSTKNAGEVFVIVNDYRRNDYRPMAFRSKDFGKTFTSIVTEKQVPCYTLSIVQDPIATDMLWLGTDCGLYLSIDGGKNWNKWMNNYPSVPTMDMKIHSRDHDLILGTFGRAFYILDDIRPLREIAQTGGKVLDKALRVFPAPDAYLANFKSYSGYHFAADGIYEGQNKATGAMLTIWNKVGASKNAATSEKAKMVVKTEKGEVIRKMSMTLDTGMVRIYWDLRKNGVAMPSRREAKPDDELPVGGSVSPGNYWFIVTLNGQSDSTMIKVSGDPRENISMADYAAQEAGFKELDQLITKATAGFTRIQDAKKAITRVESAIQLVADSTKKDLVKLGKAMTDSLNNLEKLYMMPDGLKGIQRSASNIQGSLSAVRSTMNTFVGEPTQAAKNNLNKATIEVNEAIEKINTFMTGPFENYKKKVETLSFSLFK